MVKRTVAVNEKGKRIGEDHPRAKLTNHEVELIRQLHAEGWGGYKRLGGKFGVSWAMVRDVVKGRRRCQVAMGWRTVCMA